MELPAFFSNSLDILFPKSCLVCNWPTGKEYLCKKCKPKIPDTINKCKKCFSKTSEGKICNLCKIMPLPFKSVKFLWNYDDHFRAILKVAKYKPSYKLFQILGEISSIHVINFYKKNEFDLITAMPPSFSGLKRRKFNQSEILIKEIFKTKIAKKRDELLKRTSKNKKAQVEIKDHRMRFSNTKNIFSVTKNLDGKNILLVDDVLTTGASAISAFKELKKAGAQNISLFTLAQSTFAIQFRQMLKANDGINQKIRKFN